MDTALVAFSLIVAILFIWHVWMWIKTRPQRRHAMYMKRRSEGKAPIRRH
jgi:hypothetical protein